MWGPNCPRCGKGPTDLLSTLNEFEYYCKPCDIRFNKEREIYAPKCEMHDYNMPDGHCTCVHECSQCDTTYIGHNHSKEDCIASLRKQLDAARKV